ncbi:Ribonuclease Y [bioreactor metagenome]|uniref:Ribonuclease Y n=1 Tax=bioreactor metagenome TaxID=1076179 RepID=A0A644UAA4_9ZZZZ|nr:ribonuclease Y [Candidatus Elulimicrobiales bacterium]
MKEVFFINFNLLFILLAAIAGLVLGYVGRHYVALLRKNSVENEIERRLEDAKKNAKEIEDASKKDADEMKQRLDKTEARLDKKEDELESREEAVKLEKEKLFSAAEEVKNIQERVLEKEKGINKELEKVASLSEEEARKILIEKVERDSGEDIKSRLLKISRDGEKKIEEKAKDILVSVIHRLANSNITEFMTSVVEIEDEEIKGKIIGKEGRNIKTFERASGVELLIDEIPNAVVISCFDPIRRAIAKNALEGLIKDGRIQPARIEEFLEKSKREIGTFIRQKGEEAIRETGILNIPDDILPILGRLYFRTSYGQNVLDHSIEMSHIAGMLASELGADVQVAKAGALLHDIGKTVDHEITGTHVEIGRRILMKYGVDEKVILAMQAHHEEYPYETLESVIVQVADTISGSRPGARRDSIENYIKRLSDLENLAMSFLGIEKVYALQAGREIRVFVEPKLVSDLEALSLARNIALKIETEIKYPGEIKINVIRESRVIEFAR